MTLCQSCELTPCACGCGKTITPRDWRGRPRHYVRGHNARVVPRLRPIRDIAERFWEKVDRSGGPDACWPWLAGLDRHGYGRFSIGSYRKGTHKDMRAHRVAYELAKGPIPEGLEPDHLCRSRPCCNPSHLEAVTHRENMLRSSSFSATNVTKTHCPQGHPYDVANTYTWNGQRHCRACGSDRWRARKA